MSETEKKAAPPQQKKPARKQARQGGARSSGREAAPLQAADKNVGINSAAGWAKIRSEWAKTQVEKAQAHADLFFATDEELPLSRHLILVVSAIAVFALVVWANFATLDEVTRGDGKIIPSSEVQALQSLEGGIVEEFLVAEGDEVVAGQPLMRLRDIQAASDFGSNQKRYLSLEAKVSRLQAEAEGKDTPVFSDAVMKGVPGSVTEELNSFKANQLNMKSQLQVLEQQRSQRQQEIKELNTRISDLRGIIKLSREEKAMIEPLVERGSAPKVELLQLERGIKERQTELIRAFDIPAADKSGSQGSGCSY